MKTYILNAFSTNMISRDCGVEFRPLSLEAAKSFILESKFANREIISGVGHESTAKIVSQLLGIQVPMNRINVLLDDGDNGLIMSLGFRSEEGKIYTEEELKAFVDAGRIKFHKFTIKALEPEQMPDMSQNEGSF